MNGILWVDMSTQFVRKGTIFVGICPRCGELGRNPILGELDTSQIAGLDAHISVWSDHERQLGHPVNMVDMRTCTAIPAHRAAIDFEGMRRQLRRPEHQFQ